MKVKLISYTNTDHDTPEDLIEYCARVSNPSNQLKDLETGKLIRYCIEHKHWSIFEMVDVTVEIETSTAMAKQILRHRSFSFQEFSGRYAVNDLGFENAELRLQDETNRQNSIDIKFDYLSVEKAYEYASLETDILLHQHNSKILYEKLLSNGIAKEVARFVLPQNMTTRLYMKGSVRSWIHYLEVRLVKSTQKEHRLIALEIKTILQHLLPHTFKNIGEFKC